MILSLLYFFLFVALISGIGWIVHVALFRNKTYTPQSVLLGLLLTLPVYAILKTGGKSEFVIFFIGVILLLVSVKGNAKTVFPYFIQEQKHHIKTDWIIFTVFALVYFVFQTVLWTYQGSDFVAYPVKDIAFYGRLSGYLNCGGNENTFYSPFKPEGNSIYHYGDIWLSALLSFNNYVNPTKAYLFYQIPFLLTLCSFYTFRLFVSFSDSNNLFIKAIVALFVPFYTSFSFLYPNAGVMSMDVYGATIWMMPKLLFIYLFVVISVMAFVKQNYAAMNYSVWALLFFYTAVSPTIFVFILIANYFLFKKRLIGKSDFYKYLLLFAVTGFLLFIFYSKFKDDYSPINKSANLKEYIGYIFTGNYLKVTFNSTAKVIIQMLITNSVLIALLFYLWKRGELEVVKYKTAFIWLVGIISSGVLLYTGFHFIFDSVQFWSNWYLAVIGIIYAISIYLISTTRLKIVSYIFIATQIFVHLPVKEYDLIDKETFQKAQSVFENEKNANVAVILKPENFQSVFDKNTEVYQPFTFIHFINPAYYATNIAPYLIPVSDNVKYAEIERSHINFTPFVLYVNELKKSGEFKDYTSAQISFMQKNKIKYLVSDYQLSQLFGDSIANNYQLILKQNEKVLYKLLLPNN